MAQAFLKSLGLQNLMEEKVNPPPKDEHSHPGAPKIQGHHLPCLNLLGMGSHINIKLSEARDNTP